jgi:tetratricopeptide (TPR) repeat protein
MMTGSTLFGPHTVATLTYKIVNEAPPPACTRNAALPLGVNAVLAKALAKTPSERFPSCCEFVGALAQAYSDAPTVPHGPPPVVVAQTTQPVTPVHEPAEPARRSRAPVLAAVAAVLCLGGALAVWKPWNRTPQPPDRVAAITPPKAAPVPTSAPEAPPPVAPPTPQPQDAKPTKAVSTPPKVTPPSVAPKPDEPGEPAEEVDLLPPPPPPKTGAVPTPFDAAIRRAQEAMKIKDYPGAIHSYTRAISLRPNYAPAFYNRGMAQQDLEHPELAIQNYSEAIRLAPDMVPAYSARGVCLARLHRDQEAFADFQKALELKPGLATALSGRGGVYFRRKQYRLALTDFDAAIRSNPRFAPAYTSRARTRDAVGDFGGAAADKQRGADLRKR